MKTICFICVLLVCFVCRGGDEPEFQALMPAGVAVQPLIRASEAPLDYFGDKLRLLVGPDGQPLLVAGNVLFNLAATNQSSAWCRIGGPRVLDAVAWMPGRGLLAISGRELGLVTSTGLVALCRLPGDGMQIEPAGPERIYIYGGAGDEGGGSVYLYRGDGKLLRLFASPRRVTAVAGNGESTLVACGSVVYAMTMGGPMEQVFATSEPVTSLAVVPPTGVFYSTPHTIGYLSDQASGGYVFMNGVQGVLRAGSGELFLLVAGEGAFRISCLEGFYVLNESVDAAVSAALGPGRIGVAPGSPADAGAR